MMTNMFSRGEINTQQKRNGQGFVVRATNSYILCEFDALNTVLLRTCTHTNSTKERICGTLYMCRIRFTFNRRGVFHSYLTYIGLRDKICPQTYCRLQQPPLLADKVSFTPTLFLRQIKISPLQNCDNDDITVMRILINVLVPISRA